MSTWDDKPNDYQQALQEIERLRTALKKIATADYSRDPRTEPRSDATVMQSIAYEALAVQQKPSNSKGRE